MITNDTIPNYTIKEILHDGGYTKVYRAIDNISNKRVIIKSLDEEFANPKENARLSKEYKTLENLDIPGISKVIILASIGSRRVLVMEDFGGISLSEYLKTRTISLTTFLEIAIRITDVLGNLHAQNIMHKNINPDNIVINPETGETRLIDFGIATSVSRERTAVHNPNVMEGTLPYMSPEQTGRMNRSTDYRTDLYSLGITFYKMLTGHLPYKSEDAMELIHCHLAKKMQPLTEMNSEVPEVLSEIIARQTAKIADERYQSAVGLKYDLEQCQQQLNDTGSIPFFAIATKDVISRFKIPEHLYGREKEIKKLHYSFTEVTNGSFMLMLISGYSGIGKTALVHEIHKPSVQRNGYFIAGKSNQFKANIPFYVFRNAFTELLKYLVSEPKIKLDKIRKQLLDKLGINTSVLTDLVPEFELIVGKQTSAITLNPAESKNRFFLTLRDFLLVFCNSENPLTIFLDDLQWSDDSSLSLIRELIAKEIPYLFIIGAYRQNEIHDGHPLALLIDEIIKTKKIQEVNLLPLEEKDVNQMIADTMLATTEETVELSTILNSRTGGNPFYIKELLKNIYQDGLINFNHSNGKWTWDIKKIEALNISDNVVHFMTERLQELPANCLAIIKTAACIGNHFQLKTLSQILHQTPGEICSTLWPAIEIEIIVPLHADYHLVEKDDHLQVTYKFMHDRIQQAAFELIGNEARNKMNLEIARVLIANANETEKNENLAEWVRHYNAGRTLITDEAEKISLAEMNLQAGKKAQAAVAYHSAVEYFKTGIELLPTTFWATHYDLAYELYNGYAQNAYQENDIETAETCITILLENAKTNLEKVEVLSVRLRQYNTLGKAKEAIEAGIEGLALLGISLPENPGQLAVLIEVLKAKWKLGRRKPVDLLNAPVLQDPEKKAAARLLTEIGPSAYTLGKDNLYGLTQLKIVTLSLEHGNCPESCFAYVSFGMVLSEAFGNMKAAEDFGKMGLGLIEKFGNVEYKCRVIAGYGVLTHHFNHHWHKTTEWYKKGIEAGYYSGDLFFLAYCAGNCIVWNPAFTLEASLENQKKYLQIIKDTGYHDAHDSARMHLQHTKNYLGQTADFLSLNDHAFDEADCLDNMIKRKYRSGIGMYFIHKAGIGLFYEEYEKALEAVRRADKYAKSLVSLVDMTKLCYTSFFICSGYMLSEKILPKFPFKKRMKKELGKMKKWAKYNPTNFLHLQFLMEAEQANVHGNLELAGRLYDMAIQTAQKNEWLADEAFANELAAKFHYKKGIKVSLGYWNEAFFLFKKWGATGKFTFLERNYTEVFNALHVKLHTPQNKESNTETSPAEVDNLDVLDMATIVKYSQAISGEIEFKNLLSKMIHIIMLNAGAEKGFLVLENEGELFIQASAAGNDIVSMQNIPAKESDELPQSVINYVSNLKEPIVLDNASAQGDFITDNYIKTNKPKSILCSPIVLLNKLYGIIYLENNISIGAFTKERLEVLNMLSSQMAISIQNAIVYNNLEEKVDIRTKELRLEKKKSDDLLINILPEKVAAELKRNGTAEARQFNHTTVLFTDFVNFTTITQSLSPKELVAEIHTYFTAFDEIIGKHGLEKIKTIGDAYLAVAGIPNENEKHAIHCIQAAKEILEFVNKRKTEGGLFDIRIGMNSGPVVAGIVGTKKFAYDIWGDTVNTAARMETNSEAGKINITETTYQLVKDQFNFTYRGKIHAKNKGMIEMYFLEG